MALRFGPFTLDLQTRQLIRETGEIHLSPKAFELLAVLSIERPRVLSKSELQGRLWPDTFVAEANLSNLIGEIRDALGDRARSPLFVRTVHGFGYAFCGSVDDDAASAGPSVSGHACWLEWGRRRFPLALGDTCDRTRSGCRRSGSTRRRCRAAMRGSL